MRTRKFADLYEQPKKIKIQINPTNFEISDEVLNSPRIGGWWGIGAFFDRIVLLSESSTLFSKLFTVLKGLLDPPELEVCEKTETSGTIGWTRAIWNKKIISKYTLFQYPTILCLNTY